MRRASVGIVIAALCFCGTGLTQNEEFGEWKSLFNGKDTSGWVNVRGKYAGKSAPRWEVEEGALTNESGGVDNVCSVDRFSNYELELDYKVPEGGNSGFYLQGQWELQILKKSSLKNSHADGSLYSLYPPKQLARHGPERWNHMDVKVQGTKIWAWQNGKLIHDGRQCKTRTDAHHVKTAKYSEGPFKFQGDHGKVWFANIYIKPLPPGE